MCHWSLRNDQTQRRADGQTGPYRPHGQGAGHLDHRLQYDGGGRHLQPMQPTGSQVHGQQRCQPGERDHRHGGGQREARERRQRPGNACHPQADRNAQLAGRLSRQNVAERQQVCKSGLRQPAAAFHKLGPEVGQMRGRSAERSQALPQERHEHGQGGHVPGRRGVFHQRLDGSASRRCRPVSPIRASHGHLNGDKDSQIHKVQGEMP